MYVLTRVSDKTAARLKGIATSRNTSVAAFAGSILTKYLSGEIGYIKKGDKSNEKRPF